MARLGAAYFFGSGVAKNLTEASMWMLRAAESGLARAQWMIGAMYYQGMGVTEDPQQAFRWYLESSSPGFHPRNGTGRLYVLARGGNRQ